MTAQIEFKGQQQQWGTFTLRTLPKRLIDLSGLPCPVTEAMMEAKRATRQ